MFDKRYAFAALAVVTLTSALACGLPTPTSVRPTVTPYIPATAWLQDAPSATPGDVPTLTATPPPAATDTPAPTVGDTSLPPATDTPLPTQTQTPVPPPASTATPEPTAVPTVAATVELLVIVDRGYEIVDWQPLPSKEWEGHIRIVFRGGAPPYTSSIGHRDAQAENLHYFRYAACKGAAVRADVWSADGQHAHRDLWIEAPWCPTPEPTSPTNGQQRSSS